METLYIYCIVKMSDLNLTYPEYSPSALVHQTHAIPHIYQGKHVSHTFNLTSETNWNNIYQNEYLLSVTTVPASIFYFLFLVMLLFFVVMCCRCCVKWCTCAPNYDVEHITDPAVMKHYFNSVNSLSRLFVIVVVVVVIADQLIFLGSHHLDRGYNMGQDALNFFYNIFDELATLGTSLEQDGVDIANSADIAAATTCPQAASMDSYIDTYNYDISNYMDLVNPMTSKVNDYHDILEDYAFKTKNLVLYNYYAVVMLLVLCFSLAVYYQSRWSLRFNIVWVSVLVIFLWALCTVEMATLMVISDFCMSPTQYAINLIPTGDTQDIVAYYTTCSGSDPLEPYLSQAVDSLNELNNSVSSLLTYQCPGDSQLLYIQGNLTLANTTLAAVDVLTTCEPYVEESNDFLHNALCFQLFTGSYILWVCQFVISGGVFVLLVLSTFIYQYFGTYWHMEKADLDNLVHSMEEGLIPAGSEQSTVDNRSQLSQFLNGPAVGGSMTSTVVSKSSGPQYAHNEINYDSYQPPTEPVELTDPVASSPSSRAGIPLSPLASDSNNPQEISNPIAESSVEPVDSDVSQ